MTWSDNVGKIVICFALVAAGPRVMSPNRGEDQYRTRHGEDRRRTDLRNQSTSDGTNGSVLERLTTHQI